MKHGCFTTLLSPIDSQLIGLNAINRIQSVERRNLEKRQTINSEYYIALLERLNDEIKKKSAHLKKKKCTVSQINQNDGKIA
jgi:uncharacterized OsmC-like protein